MPLKVMWSVLLSHF